MKKNLLKNNGVQSLIASLVCIVLGLFIGYIVLLFINPTGAGNAIVTIVKNFMTYNRPQAQLKYMGNTLVKTAPLLLCSLSILFSYKVGLFNIGAAGQYCAGVALALYTALGLGWSWLPCLVFAMLAGALLGCISGVLKSYRNVNEVISGITGSLNKSGIRGNHEGAQSALVGFHCSLKTGNTVHGRHLAYIHTDSPYLFRRTAPFIPRSGI